MNRIRIWLMNWCIEAAVVLMPQRDKNAISKIFREKLLRAQRSPRVR